MNWALNVVEQNQPGTTRTSILRPNSAASATNPASVRASDPAVQTLVAQLSNGIVGTDVQRIPLPDRSSSPLLFEGNICARHTSISGTSASSARSCATRCWKWRTWETRARTCSACMNANQATITPEFIASFQAAQAGVRTGTVGKLLDTYGASLPSSMTTALANNDMGTFISGVDTGVFNNVVGGRLVAAGLGQGYFRNPQFTTAALALQLHR